MNSDDFKSVFTIDVLSGRLFWKCPPTNHPQLVGQEAGYINRGKGKNKDYWQIRANGQTFKRSRVIFFVANGRWPTPSIDHINGISTDDRLANLRECSHSENNASARNKARTSPLPRGVYQTPKGKFVARLTRSSVTKNLGTFETADEAHSIYMVAKKELYGEFV